MRYQGSKTRIVKQIKEIKNKKIRYGGILIGIIILLVSILL